MSTDAKTRTLSYESTDESIGRYYWEDGDERKGGCGGLTFVRGSSIETSVYARTTRVSFPMMSEWKHTARKSRA
jgi:hypothetical protein